jgi:transcription elongation factor Elf1
MRFPSNFLRVFHHPIDFRCERCEAALTVTRETLIKTANGEALVICRCGWFNQLREGQTMPRMEAN